MMFRVPVTFFSLPARGAGRAWRQAGEPKRKTEGREGREDSRREQERDSKQPSMRAHGGSEIIPGFLRLPEGAIRNIHLLRRL